MAYLQCWVDGPDCSSTCICLLGDDAAVVRIIFTSQLNPLTAIVSFKVADPKPAHSALWDCRWHYKHHGHIQSCVDKLLTMVRISFKSQRNEKCWPPVNYKYTISPAPVIRVQCVWRVQEVVQTADKMLSCVTRDTGTHYSAPAPAPGGYKVNCSKHCINMNITPG